MPEWLGVFFGGTNGRRLHVAVAISIALHEIVAGLFRGTRKRSRPARS